MRKYKKVVLFICLIGRRLKVAQVQQNCSGTAVLGTIVMIYRTHKVSNSIDRVVYKRKERIHIL